MKSRPDVLEGKSPRIETGCGWLYVTINTVKDKVVEISASLGKSGGCASANLQSITQLINTSIENGTELDAIVKILRGQRCHNQIISQGKEVYSCPDGIAQCLEKYLPKKDIKDIKEEVKELIDKEKK